MSPRPMTFGGRKIEDPITTYAEETGRLLTMKFESCVIKERVKTDDGGGENEINYQVKYADAPCFVEDVGRKTVRQAPVGGQINSHTTHMIHFYPDIEISAEDIIEKDGMTWIILAVLENTHQPTQLCEAKIK